MTNSRPPKPDGIASSPRYRSSSKRPKVFDELAALIRAQPTPIDFPAFQREADSETSHRGAAILLAANVENALDSALFRLFHRDRADLLFGLDKPLGSFRNKVLIAYALNVFGSTTFRNLEIIRNVRNAFAHAKIPINFDTVQVANVCSEFIVTPITPPFAVGSDNEDPSSYGPRQMFQFMCNRLAHNLGVQNLGGVLEINPLALKGALDSRYQRIQAAYAPLP